jgi:hypothetical protein
MRHSHSKNSLASSICETLRLRGRGSFVRVAYSDVYINDCLLPQAMWIEMFGVKIVQGMLHRWMFLTWTPPEDPRPLCGILYQGLWSVLDCHVTRVDIFAPEDVLRS